MSHEGSPGSSPLAGSSPEMVDSSPPPMTRRSPSPRRGGDIDMPDSSPPEDPGSSPLMVDWSADQQSTHVRLDNPGPQIRGAEMPLPGINTGSTGSRDSRQRSSQQSQSQQRSSQRHSQLPSSSPINFSASPGSSPVPLPTSSSLASDVGEDRLRRIRNAGRRGDVPSDSRFSTTSDLGSEPVRVIWGTNVSIQETMDTFRRFLTGFKRKYRISLDEKRVVGPGEGDEAVYLDMLMEMRKLGASNLNLDARNLLAYPGSHRLFYQLVNYPQEVIPIMDQAVKDHMIALVSADATASARELDAIEATAYRVRPYGLEAKTGLRELNPTDIDKLVTVKGLVLRSTPVIPDMTEAFFRCAVCNHTVVVEIDRGVITEPTRCPRQQCRALESMRLVHNRSRFSDKQVVRLQETPDVIPDGQTPHSVSLCVYDELVDYCRAGDRIQVTGVFRSVPVRANPMQRVLKSLYKTYVDVVHVQKLDMKRLGADVATLPTFQEQVNSQQSESQHGGGASSQTQNPEVRPLTEEDIARIHELAARPDLYELLARSLAPSIYEQDDVKKGILLQLFGGANKTFTKGGSPRYRGDINILLCGDPSTSKSQMLQYVHKIAPRGMYTSGKGSSAVGLTAYVTRDTETKQLVLESGALVLSDGGVCCIDEFDKMSEATRSVLHEVMEQQTVSIAKAGIITTLNARTSLLASANPIGSKYNPNLSVPQNIDLPPTLLSRFDLVYLMIDKVDVQSDRRLAQHLAQMYVDDAPHHGTEEEIVPVEMLASYISYAKQHITPQITRPAREELVKAYVAMRKLGEDSRAAEKRITATTRQLESMIRLSEAHAKMRLSQLVEVKDVQEAVRLIRSAIKEYAIDPATGAIDMDLVQTGQSRAQREMLDQFKSHALALLEGSEGGMRYEDLVRRVADMSPDRVDVQEVAVAIRAMSQEGAVVIQGGPRRLVRLT